MYPRLKISLASSASDFPAKTQFELRSIIGIRPKQWTQYLLITAESLKIISTLQQNLYKIRSSLQQNLFKIRSTLQQNLYKIRSTVQQNLLRSLQQNLYEINLNWSTIYISKSTVQQNLYKINLHCSRIFIR